MSKSPPEYVATFIAGPSSAPLREEAVCRALARSGVAAPTRTHWLDPGVALDVRFPFEPALASSLRAGLHEALEGLAIDVVVQPWASRRKALLVADMDSTMIAQECVDELAELAGLRDHVANITERAMRGEIEFEPALRERVGLLAGLRVDAIDGIIDQRIRPTAGARALVATMRANGAYTALVSGGFTLFADRIGALLGFHETRANKLEVAGGALTGVVAPPILGRAAKRDTLEALRAARGLAREATLAVGDGANDLDMLLEAGLGVAFHAKPKVASAAHARIDHADLTALLFAQGYRRSDFVERPPPCPSPASRERGP
ncbi:MAG: phosphoserine phosphatase SerB [Methylocystis sp.]|nr:phosphoserine phosphatase SerB [Methylocystis sp.]MBI3275203.1 phosphoserine phosphatase SerB [Methylocystis sp.]